MVEKHTSDAQIQAALERGRQADLADPRALSVRYDAAARRMVVELTNGCALAFPAEAAQGLRGADPAALAQVEVVAGGRALRWDALDVDLGVGPLVQGIFGTAAWMRELRSEMGRTGGRASTPAKATAARENGRKGGRPRKHPVAADPRREA
ncbi:MAG TPA: DUF2442 domain-containing protein [Longimicrobium sp.]|jgi:general stress protein YciG|nr:DUF2442 domain-containing protein [Longimicrobium sp.]